MTTNDPLLAVQFKTATVQRIFVVLMVLMFAMAALGIVGEVLGWWNDAGEVVTIVGAVGGLLLGAATLSLGATEGNVTAVHGAVVANGRKLDKLDTLDTIQFELDRQTDVLEAIRDRL